MTPQQMQTCSDAEFLDLLAQREIELRVQDGKLRISAPAGILDEALKAELMRRKSILLERFDSANRPAYSEKYKRAPLSYAQERLWLLERFHPGNFAYNIPESFEINTAIDPAVMQRSIYYVLQRHAVLRTSFVEERDGSATQQVHATLSIPLECVDLQNHGSTARLQRLQSMLRGFSREPFDLSIAPLVRFFLIRLEPEKYVVSINIHHIIADRWSLRVLYRDLLAAYQAYAQNREPALAPLPMQYTEYARNERSSARTNGSLHPQLRYWKDQLSAIGDPPELPFRLPATTVSAFDGAMHPLELNDEDTAYLRGIARKHNASIYMVLLAAFAALIHRYTGAGDFCIGSPVTERTSTATEGLVGLFVNTLVMRCKVNADETFAELLQHLRETVLDAQGNKEVPLQRVLQELHPVGGAGAQPLFQTMFAFDAYMGGESESGQIAVDPGVAKFDMTLQMNEGRDRIGGWFEYRKDLFAPESIAKFSDAFLLLLQDAVCNPDRRVAELTILGEAERTRLLHTWNRTEMPFPLRSTIHRLFEEQVNRTPDATAVVDGTAHVSYRELNRRANGIAYGLIEQGVLVETIVGVHLARTIDMVAAMLGILKSGGAYLPLDPLYPEQRLNIMLEDSKCQLVVSGSKSRLAPNTRMCSPAFTGIADEKLAQNPEIIVSPSNLAYIIYTSGSTGRPKGVGIEHHSTVSFLEWAKNTFSRQILQGTLAATSISFDLSIFEIFVPLVTGNTVILAGDILEFSGLPAAAQVTLVTTVPSAAAALLATGKIPNTVRAMNLAGEALSTGLVDRLYQQTSIVDVNDLYGPTETTTYSTWNRRFPGRTPTIGRPIANTRVYLVDASLQLVPEGVPGELLIAGQGVARGYLGNPELTAVKFVSLMHISEVSIAYRTGDLCRYQPDGTLEYLGRMDNQVKVRGFRIEVAEIEAALMQHSSIRDAVVVARADGDKGASLVAYVVQDDAKTLDMDSLMAHQAKILPGHMIVRQLLPVHEFPRTANGKVDRKQLVAIAPQQSSVYAEAYPQDPLERELVGIWREGFARSDLGIDDDFFQLGGHSLLALRLFAEIEAKLGHKMMLSVLFRAPTIRKLAEFIRRQSSS